jgi:uncharacterized protein (TIRG00374 family)
MIKHALTRLRGEAQGKVTLRDRRKGSKWIWINVLLAFLASGVFLYLAFCDVDFAQLWREVRAAEGLYLFAAILAGGCTNVIRAVRWGVLYGKKPPAGVRTLFTSMMIGYMANNVLPARMGELVRIYVLKRKAGVSKSTSAATIFLERVTDALILVALVGALSFFVPLPKVVREGSRLAAIGFGALLLLLLFLSLRGENLMRPILRFAGALSYGARRILQGILERFIQGLGALRRGRQFMFVLLLTAAAWSIDAVSVNLVIRSMHLSMPWFASLFVLVVLSLSFVIPSAPGAVGTYEFFVMVALTPFVVETTQAAGLALVLHAVFLITSTSLGLICLWAERLSLSEVVKSARNQKE